MCFCLHKLQDSEICVIQLQTFQQWIINQFPINKPCDWLRVPVRHMVMNTCPKPLMHGIQPKLLFCRNPQLSLFPNAELMYVMQYTSSSDRFPVTNFSIFSVSNNFCPFRWTQDLLWLIWVLLKTKVLNKGNCEPIEI